MSDQDQFTLNLLQEAVAGLPGWSVDDAAERSINNEEDRVFIVRSLSTDDLDDVWVWRQDHLVRAMGPGFVERHSEEPGDFTYRSRSVNLAEPGVDPVTVVRELISKAGTMQPC